MTRTCRMPRLVRLPLPKSAERCTRPNCRRISGGVKPWVLNHFGGFAVLSRKSRTESC